MGDARVVTRCASTFEAELVATTLREAGIPASVQGQLLQDEFALSQRLLGVEVHVPRACLEDARALLDRVRDGAYEENDADS